VQDLDATILTWHLWRPSCGEFFYGRWFILLFRTSLPAGTIRQRSGGPRRRRRPGKPELLFCSAHWKIPPCNRMALLASAILTAPQVAAI